jgi:hypothetical protein
MRRLVNGLFSATWSDWYLVGSRAPHELIAMKRWNLAKGRLLSPPPSVSGALTSSPAYPPTPFAPT